jgi:hypothetical protein
VILPEFSINADADYYPQPTKKTFAALQRYALKEMMKQYSAPEIENTTCEKCKGTGVLDFEFYTRKCECQLE